MAGGNHVGTVVQLNRKSQVPGEHGLPKIPVPAARITKAVSKEISTGTGRRRNRTTLTWPSCSFPSRSFRR